MAATNSCKYCGSVITSEERYCLNCGVSDFQSSSVWAEIQEG